MNARLVAFSGPVRGASVSFADEPLSIGRDEDNRLALPDRLVSRHHCRVTLDDGRPGIEDLGSHNGTFVNGVPVLRRVLQHGDQIRVGRSLFVALLGDDATVPSIELDADEGAPESSTIVLRPEEARVQRRGVELPPGSPAARMAAELEALLRIADVAHQPADPAAMQRRVLELVAEVVPVQFGAIVLTREPGADIESLVGWSRDAGRPAPVSRTIVARSLTERVAVLSNDAGSDPGLREATGIREALVRSVLCAPLLAAGRPLGALYLATRDPRARFDESHLHLVTAAAAIVAMALDHARRVAWLESETHRLGEDLDLEHRMIGESQAARAVHEFVARVAPTDATVLVRGESGTGKELVARAIHRSSPRAARPFVAINCAAITETLLESELFGHERGAFTGAVARKRGKLEVADGGTLFLDEVCELAPLLQAKLLRVLQERQFERVGGTLPIGVDIRVIAATNSNVEQALREGRLREDLYYRLNVVSITLPPLRERRDDIPLLARFFVDRYAGRCKRHVSGVSVAATELLVRYDWPGNVRELENAIERAVVLGSTDDVLPEDLPDSVLDAVIASPGPDGGYYEAIVRTKKALILDALERTGGNYTEAAHRLGLYPTSLHRLIRQLGLKDRLKPD